MTLGTEKQKRVVFPPSLYLTEILGTVDLRLH